MATDARRSGTKSADPHRLVAAAYYGGLLLLLALILTTLLDRVLPAELSSRIGFNSEGYLLALVLGLWIQFVRPRLTEAMRWRVTWAVAAGFLGLAVVLYLSDVPSRFKTLNETFFALTLILPYLTLHRPLRRWPLLVSAALFVGVVVGVAVSPADSPVVLLAETMAALILVPPAFDLVDRGILDPSTVTRAGLRYGWYALLIAVPVAVVLLGTGARSGGGFHEVLQYVGRVHEGVIGVLLVQLYLAVALGRTGRSPSQASPVAVGRDRQ